MTRKVIFGLCAALVFASLAYLIAQLANNPAADNKVRPTSQQPTAVPSKPVREENNHAGELQALLGSLVAAKGDYAISVIEPDGRRASVNGGKQYTATSTYKLFVAYGVFQRINSGDMHWSDPTFGGHDASACFELLIVESNNDCNYAFADKIGWQAIDDMMTNIGLAATQVKWQDNITTADDLALFLTKLQAGTLLNKGDTDKLVGLMKRQIHRRGIPAGTGVTVADKPGFLDGLLHDAAIVYGPKGPYILVILSDGSSWAELADAAKQIHTFLQQ